MSDRERAILPAIRQAFDGDDIARKNIMLRQAHDCIREMSAALAQARAEGLRQAADICDRYFDSHGRFIAPTIRALAEGGE